MRIIVATLIMLGVIASALAQDFSFISWAYWQEEGDSGTSRSEVFRNFGLFVAAGVALVFAFWRAKIATRQAEAAAERADATIKQARAANEQARIAEQGHITERFSRAIEQLGHNRPAVRIGGLYALKRIAEDSVERDHLTIMDVLTSFIRQPPYANRQREAAERGRELRPYKIITRSGSARGTAEPPPEPELIDCPDIVAAIEIINSRSEDQKKVEDKRKYRLSLSRASLSYLRLPEVGLHIFDLAGANLTGTDLTRANLVGAKLVGAKLLDANLVDASLLEADLSGADLSGANLTGADLTDAILRFANLKNADLVDAVLTGAKLMSADLAGANLKNADLLEADLRRAELMDANLTDADLTVADLTNADLTRTILTDADLTDANLTAADLTDANLTAADLTGAKLTRANNLSQKQLALACIKKGGEPPTLPGDLEPPHAERKW